MLFAGSCYCQFYYSVGLLGYSASMLGEGENGLPDFGLVEQADGG
jgi:hypothetical protein